jgi:HK97 gp10 family phage protein
LHQVLSRYTKAKSGDYVTLSNSVFYAYFVNYGTKNQPAQHFVERAIAQIEKIAQAAAVKVSLSASPPTRVG